MKKFMTMAMAAAMAASMGTTALAADTKTATASNAGVLVNGAEIAPEAYTIDGYTFFKLRDVAAAVAGTEAGFDVTWDAEAKKIALTTGVSYEAAAEAGKKAEGEKAATLSTAPVLVDGEEAVLTAYTIDGYTYFKLRDLGTAAGFEVTWDNEAKMIGIHAPVLEEGIEEDVELTEEEMQEKLEEFYDNLEQVVEEEGLDELEEVVVDEEADDVEIVEDAESFTYILKENTVYEWDGETFEKDVILSCSPVEEGADFYDVIFTNCAFEGDVFLVADGQAEVVIGEGCTFAEGKGVVVLEFTEGSALTKGNESLCSVLVQTEGVDVTAKNAVAVRTAVGISGFTLNGTEHSEADFADVYGVGQIMSHELTYYYENDVVGYVMTHEGTSMDAEGNVSTVYAGD